MNNSTFIKCINYCATANHLQEQLFRKPLFNPAPQPSRPVVNPEIQLIWVLIILESGWICWQ